MKSVHFDYILLGPLKSGGAMLSVDYKISHCYMSLSLIFVELHFNFRK